MSANSKRLILSIIWIITGAVLIILAATGKLDSTFYSGLGGGLAAVGILQTIRHLKYSRNEEYREKIDTEAHDERNRYLRMKAWSVTGYVTVLCAAIGSIAAKVTGKDEICTILSTAVALIVLVYWVSYLIMNKRN